MQRPAALLAVFGLVTAGLVALPATIAAADETCTFDQPFVFGDSTSDYAEGLLVVGVDHTRYLTFAALDTTEGCIDGQDSLEWNFQSPLDGPSSTPITYYYDDNDDNAKVVRSAKVNHSVNGDVGDVHVYAERDIDPWQLTNDYAGVVQHDWATSDDDPSVSIDMPSYVIKRETRLTVNATPEPVKKGKTLTVRGKLTRASWNDLAYHHYGSKTVTLQFRTPHGSFHDIKNAAVHADGSIKTRVKDSHTGVWRFAYAGDSTSGASVAEGDAVKVH